MVFDQGASFTDPLNGERVAYARSKMTRKDAVVGLEFVIQVGNQDDYRNKDKDKTPIKGTGFGAKLNDSINEIHTWATKKFELKISFL